MVFDKRGQIWIETVIYTLIGLALIGIVLAIITPAISQSRDKAVVEQSINSLTKLDSKILEVLEWGPGNLRTIDLTMRRGEIYFNSSGDEIILVIRDLDKPYSEPGEIIKNGRINIRSEQGQKSSSTYLSVEYGGMADLVYDGEEMLKKFDATTTPYSFIIENKDDVVRNLPVIDFREDSV